MNQEEYQKMIDIKFLRENPDVVKQNIKNKFQDSKLPLVDEKSTAPFIVMDTDILFKGIPSKRTFMFSSEQIDTPALPTSPTTRSWSGS